MYANGQLGEPDYSKAIELYKQAANNEYGLAMLRLGRTYENGWYDGCAVMIRRLLETLIVEVFENYKIATKIQNPNGDFYYLSDLISCTLSETSWNLSRNSRQSMPKLKTVGDLSAHSRRYNAHKSDIDNIIPDLRVVVQELLYLAGLK